MEPKTGKRIVSKREYVSIVGRYTGLVTSRWCIVGLAMLCGFACFLGVLSLLSVLVRFSYKQHQEGFGVLLFVIVTAGLGGASSLLARLGFARIEKASEINVVPLTRANTADLPAPESLVRASSEPQQAQEAVLLRAVAEGQETPPEQLVRASVGE